MPHVNYLIFNSFFSLLQRYQQSHEVQFSDFNLDDEEDLTTIVNEFISPVVEEADVGNQEAIARTIAYYSEHDDAPFQSIRDEYPELSLSTPKSWPMFFHHIGMMLFGQNYRDIFEGLEIQEFPNDIAASKIFSPDISEYESSPLFQPIKKSSQKKQYQKKRICARVNYYLFAKILGILEGCELFDDVIFGEYDPDNNNDLSKIVYEFIEPVVKHSAVGNQEAIARTIAFYSENGDVPFQNIRDQRQELSLPDPKSWPLFYHRVGELLFGKYYRDKYIDMDFEELPSRKDSTTIFSPLWTDND